MLLGQLLQWRLLRFHSDVREWDVLLLQLQRRLLSLGPEVSEWILLRDCQHLRRSLSDRSV